MSQVSLVSRPGILWLIYPILNSLSEIISRGATTKEPSSKGTHLNLNCHHYSPRPHQTLVSILCEKGPGVSTRRNVQTTYLTASTPIPPPQFIHKPVFLLRDVYFFYLKLLIWRLLLPISSQIIKDVQAS